VYSTPLPNDKVSLFVYDLNSGKSTKVFQKPGGGISWDETSQNFYIRSIRYPAITEKEALDPENYWVTIIVSLN
jgi:hypothetical protein